MKKILLFIMLFLSFCKVASAGELFHLGEKVPDIVIYMDRINKKVYYQPKKIYRNSTNELVYCIQPGVVLSNNDYESYEEFNEIFNISEEKFNKIKLIAYYGYNYMDHTDIKWYAITQFLIWNEIKPDDWVMYFSNLNHDRLDDLYSDEIREIYDLVNSHNKSLNISKGYILNNKKDITIKADKEINNYVTTNGVISNNNIILDNLNYGNNDITLTFNNYNPVLFYYNDDGQNVFKRGDVFDKYINFYVYVKAGKVNISECDENDFNHHFIGGTYEVLNEDDAVLSEITCEENGCISDYLPVGFHKIRVKSLPDNYNVNDHIYDVEIKDKETSDVTICSLLKKENQRKALVEPKIEEEKEEPYEYEDIEVIEDENIEIVDVPNTSKYSYSKCVFTFILFINLLILYKYVKNAI